LRKPNLPPGARRASRPSAGATPARPAVAKPVSAKPAVAKSAAVKPAKAAKSPTPKPSAKPDPKQARNTAPRPSRFAGAGQARKVERRNKREIRAQMRQRLSEVRRFTGESRLRRTIAFSLLGSITALVLLVLATVYTPLLAINKIEIVGLHRMKESTVMNAVKTLVGTPLTTVSDTDIKARLANFPLIESFATVAMPPHTLQLYVQERQPIGLVTIGGTDYLYDPAGVQIGPATTRANHPLILVNGDPATSPSFREAVSVLLALPIALYPKVSSIQATTVDDVRIQLRGISNRQILWGDASDSALKSRVLAALIKHVKHQGAVVIDVSSPHAPTVRYGNF
jgi:cell division protein FtsQ